MGRTGSKSTEHLSEEESSNLEAALCDGFSIYGSVRPRVVYPLEGVVDEPFFGSKVGQPGWEASHADYAAEMREDGYTEDEIEDKYEDYLDELVSDDAPHWLETNPFGFDLKLLTQFFSERYEEMTRREGHEYLDTQALPEPREIIMMLVPYSKAWFETAILIEISDFVFFTKYPKHSDIAPFARRMAFESAGKIGRMVEHYRWRFSYGVDAQRGRTTVRSARKGGEAKRGATRNASKQVIAKMEYFVAQGNSVSNAARLTFVAGLGTSKEANRKLWNRRRFK